jgi:hypothetical protein
MAISGNASMNPMNRPWKAPVLKEEVLERAPTTELMKAMRAAKPTPIQKMEGIKSAPYRTDNREGMPTDPRRSPTAAGIHESFLNS